MIKITDYIEAFLCLIGLHTYEIRIREGLWTKNRWFFKVCKWCGQEYGLSASHTDIDGNKIFKWNKIKK